MNHFTPARSTLAVVGLCAGKDCRRSREFGDLRSTLTRCTIVETRCLDICHGPVVIVGPQTADPVVLSKLRTAKEIRDVQRLIDGAGTLSGRLKKRRVLGGKRRAALRRAARTFRR
jgi:hypothetical protein